MLFPTLALTLNLAMTPVPLQKPVPKVDSKAFQSAPQAAKDAVNNFAFGTLARLVASNKSGNTMISPWSLQECLGMLRLGAQGTTEKELSTFLMQPSSARSVGKELQQMRKALTPLASTDTIRQANGIWLKQGFTPEASFTSDVKNLFAATSKVTTFPEPGLGQINKFVSDTTRGKIPKLFSRLDGNTALVLVNAVSFLDKWQTPFKKASTKNLPFHTTGSGDKNVPTMTANAKFDYAENEKMQILSLPYKSGLAMAIVLPKKGTTVAQALGQANLFEAIQRTRHQQGTIFLPKWKSEFTWNLKEWMQSHGVKTAFDPGTANFQGISKKTQLFVSQALQKTFIRVDEEGTEAAAATGAAVSLTSMPMDPFTFRADHPFAYMIYAPGGIVYFAGVVNNPLS